MHFVSFFSHHLEIVVEQGAVLEPTTFVVVLGEVEAPPFADIECNLARSVFSLLLAVWRSYAKHLALWGHLFWQCGHAQNGPETSNWYKSIHFLQTLFWHNPNSTFPHGTIDTDLWWRAHKWQYLELFGAVYLLVCFCTLPIVGVDTLVKLFVDGVVIWLLIVILDETGILVFIFVGVCDNVNDCCDWCIEVGIEVGESFFSGDIWCCDDILFNEVLEAPGEILWVDWSISNWLGDDMIGMLVEVDGIVLIGCVCDWWLISICCGGCSNKPVDVGWRWNCVGSNVDWIEVTDDCCWSCSDDKCVWWSSTLVILLRLGGEERTLQVVSGKSTRIGEVCTLKSRLVVKSSASGKILVSKSVFIVVIFDWVESGAIRIVWRSSNKHGTVADDEVEAAIWSWTKSTENGNDGSLWAHVGKASGSEETGGITVVASVVPDTQDGVEEKAGKSKGSNSDHICCCSPVDTTGGAVEKERMFMFMTIL